MDEGHLKQKLAPTQKPKKEDGFKEFLYNPETGAVLGRTGMSWLLIFIFYIIFYIALAAFSLLNFYLFYLTISVDAPKWTMDSSLIGTNPGVGFRPRPDQEDSTDSTLIWFKQQDPNDFKFWSKQLEEFIEKIEEIQKDAGDDKTHSCTLGTENTTNRNKSCIVDLKQLGPCTKENDFGYGQGKPCFIIKLNKIYGWKPEAYGYKDTKSEFNQELFERDMKREQGKGMPEDLARHIKQEVDKLDRKRDALLLRRHLETVWISCLGENVADMENVGEILYYPMQGIPSYYFPYMNQKGYQPPFIMVQFTNPVHGVLINVECKAFAKNVISERIARVGQTHFELLID
ncbi:unnamed protein product [Orchesella dallaii]|uniref:Sodium/potassium-transporting ATPase subunit beta-2 n=1 Tax=Orchesella dallaii TaxID=48710 RepID=A0ABP1PRI5_9HEXA